MSLLVRHHAQTHSPFTRSSKRSALTPTKSGSPKAALNASDNASVNGSGNKQGAAVHVHNKENAANRASPAAKTPLKLVKAATPRSSPQRRLVVSPAPLEEPAAATSAPVEEPAAASSARL